VVIGSVAIDLACDYNPLNEGIRAEQTQSSLLANTSPQMHTSNIATITPSIGGVGHNVALAAQYASGSQVVLYSVVAKDL
jgi:pseudouridine-5'-phosphate glycosidase/pseudouridine kinase